MNENILVINTPIHTYKECLELLAAWCAAYHKLCLECDSIKTTKKQWFIEEEFIIPKRRKESLISNKNDAYAKLTSDEKMRCLSSGFTLEKILDDILPKRDDGRHVISVSLYEKQLSDPSIFDDIIIIRYMNETEQSVYRIYKNVWYDYCINMSYILAGSTKDFDRLLGSLIFVFNDSVDKPENRDFSFTSDEKTFAFSANIDNDTASEIAGWNGSNDIVKSNIDKEDIIDRYRVYNDYQIRDLLMFDTIFGPWMKKSSLSIEISMSYVEKQWRLYVHSKLSEPVKDFRIEFLTK